MKKRALHFALISIVISILCSILLYSGIFNTWQDKLTNRLYQPSEVHEDIVIVGIDDKSLNAFSERQGITDRGRVAQIMSNIAKYDPQVVALDYMFVGETDGMSGEELGSILQKIAVQNLDRDQIGLEFFPYFQPPHPTDITLGESLEEIKTLVFPTRLINVGNVEKAVIKDGKIMESGELFLEHADETGVISVLVDPQDNVIREYFTTLSLPNGNQLSSFALTIARVVGSPYVDQIPVTDANKRMYINYFGLPGSFAHLSAIDVLNDDIQRKDIEGKIVFFGATSPRMNDIEHTPIAPKQQMPGVEIHANALQTILDGKFLVDASPMLKIAGIIVMTALAVGACMFFSIRTSIAAFVTLWVAYYFANKMAFKNGIILDQMYPYLALVLSLITVYIYKFFTESKEKAFIAEAFGSYVSPEVLEQITKDPSKLALGGEEKIVTVFFSDIHNFTNISEKLSAQGTVKLLNEFFTEMSQIIIANGGTVDKFEGDAIMAVFGAPLPDENHPLLACKAALEMQMKLNELRAKWKEEGHPELFSRFGINTGPVVAGNVGSRERFDYTVMGDTVNLGSRLEGANKFYGTSIMIGKDTNDLLQGQFVTRQLDKLRVKGKDYPVEVYELLCLRTEGQMQGLEQVAQVYQEGLNLYFSKQFEQAKTKFQKCISLKTNDGPSTLMMQRCDSYIQNPPAEDWDGVFTLHQK